MLQPAVHAFESSPHRAASVFLVVDDDENFARETTAQLSTLRPCISAPTLRAARQLLSASTLQFSGFVVGLRLADGTGISLASEARARAPHAPAMLAVDSLDRAVLMAASRLGLSCVLRSEGNQKLAAFGHDAIAAELGIDAVVRRRVRRLAADYEVRGPELEVLLAKVAGLSANQVMTQRGLTRSTYRLWVRTLLGRLGVSSLQHACQLLDRN